MQTIKAGWVGQTFALATYNDSGGRKTRIRRSKEERKTMIETFIKKFLDIRHAPGNIFGESEQHSLSVYELCQKIEISEDPSSRCPQWLLAKWAEMTRHNRYQTSNNGNFPSLNLTHKEVGGSFYTVREIVREIIQENKVLGPAKLLPGEQNDVQFAEQYPLGSISTEPRSLSLSEENHLMSTFTPIHYMGKSEADFGMNTQLDAAEAKVAVDGPQTSTSDFNERIEQSDESYIIDSESDHQINKDELSYFSGINGFDQELRNEQMVGDYETTGENEISGKSDLLDNISVNHQNTDSQVLDSFEIISDPVNESLSSGVDACHPTVVKDETYEEPISTKSVVRESMDVESGKNELEASKDKPLKTTELQVEQFPLRPISKKIDDLDSGLNETISVAKTSEETEIEQDIISSSEKDAELINEPVDVMTADPASEKASILSDQKAELKARDASLEISSASEERAAVATDVIVKASSTVNGTVKASSPMLNETFDSSSNNGTSKKLAADELIEAKGKASVQHDSSKQKVGSPPLDRIHLETWKGASAKSKEHETNPLLALLKACITAFVKFWTEE